MSAESDAYEAARRLIAEAQRTGVVELDLNTDETRALTALPPGIAKLDQLRVLNLVYTQVTDLAALAGLTALTSLNLVGTEVTDLAGLTG